ncbi:MAG: acyl carrier protein [Acidobacteriota bacterium]
MDKNEMQRQARAVIAELSDHEASNLEPSMDLVADLGFDSPKALQLLVTLEERLDIEISDDDAAKLDSVGDIDAYLAAL